MPDIDRPVEFNEAALASIEAVTSQPGFRYQDWGGEALEGVRSFIRNHYRIVQFGRCSYCRNTVSLDSALNCHVEHIVPKSLHPEFMFEPRNLCVVCADCGGIKRNQETAATIMETIQGAAGRVQYPRSSGAFLIVHPHFDVYGEHIHIILGRYYVDKSDKGAFTIRACELNRHLRIFGWDPRLFDEVELEAAMRAYLDGQGVGDRVVALARLKDLIAAI